jgi:hypothetical protein
MKHDFIIITSKRRIGHFNIAERAIIDFSQILDNMTLDQQKEFLKELAKSMACPKRCGGLDYKNR